MYHHFIEGCFNIKNEDVLNKRTVLPKKESWQPYSNRNVSVTLSLFSSFKHKPGKTLPQIGFGLWLTV